MIRHRPDRPAGKNAPDDTLCSYINANKNEPGIFRACLRFNILFRHIKLLLSICT